MKVRDILNKMFSCEEVSDICANMYDNVKITYILFVSEIEVSCYLKNTPREIMEYQLFYVDTYYDRLYIYIEK